MAENIRLSIRGIISHKLRSFLTMLGIIIGIASIIAIVSTIQGTNEQIQKNLIGSGVNNVNIVVNQGDWEYDWYSGVPEGISVVSEDQKKRLADIENAESVSLYRRQQDYDGVYHLADSLSGGYVYGIDAGYLSTCGLAVKEGRGISQSDIEAFRKVCLLDADSETALFQGEQAVGRTIEIHGEPFRVVGLVAEKHHYEPQITTMEEYYTYYQDAAGRVYVPESVWPVLYQYDVPQSAVIRTANTGDMTGVGKEAEKILNESIKAADSDYKYKAVDLLKQARDMQQLSQSTNMMLLWIAAISLLVGGIGVMNIMLVSVTERISEIGLKKAVGAPRRAIMGQFLTEAVVLTSVGGLLGVIVGLILAKLISNINGIPVAVSWPATIVAVLFSMLIGIIFGLLPSRKAANLDPIEALRHE